LKNRLYCKILAVGIIVLFIGVSVSSGFAVDTNQSKTVSQNEECQECDKSESEICDLLEALFVSYILRAIGFSYIYEIIDAVGMDLLSLLAKLHYNFFEFRYNIINSLGERFCDWNWFP
jgi:hypothetical protein